MNKDILTGMTAQQSSMWSNGFAETVRHASFLVAALQSESFDECVEYASGFRKDLATRMSLLEESHGLMTKENLFDSIDLL